MPPALRLSTRQMTVPAGYTNCTDSTGTLMVSAFVRFIVRRRGGGAFTSTWGSCLAARRCNVSKILTMSPWESSEGLPLEHHDTTFQFASGWQQHIQVGAIPTLAYMDFHLREGTPACGIAPPCVDVPMQRP